MKGLISYFRILAALILAVAAGGLCAAGQQSPDSALVDQFIISDTLSLDIPGTSKELTFYLNGLVFLSNSKFHQKMIPDHIAFGRSQTYFVPLEYISMESSRPLFDNDPFPYSPGGMSFSRDYRTVYFTKPVNFGRRTVEKIYEASIINSEVSQDRQLSFCSDPARYMHPAISVDGSLMVFASDRMPSSGGLDLYMVRKEEAGWGNPANLGRNINTSGHEWFPFLDKHNNLYFSSSGHMGYGGYDIYVCLFDGTLWGEPRNLTELINTGADDIAFSIHPNHKQVVYSSTSESDASRAQAFLLKLNAGALLIADVEESRSRDISLLFKDMVLSGYTPSETSPDAIASGTPVLPEQKAEPAETSKEPESPAVEQELRAAEEKPQVKEQVLQAAEEIKQPSEPPGKETATAQAEPDKKPVDPAPGQVVFRVQILSNPRANSMPSVTIGGQRYDTFEYYFKGAYRITVGSYATVKEALELRNRCKDAGYAQAFVAAFRGNERELDPSVFRQ